MNSLAAIVARAKKLWPEKLLKNGMINTRLMGLGLLGIILLVCGGIFDNQAIKPKTQVPIETIKTELPNNPSYESLVEGKLASILTKVKGAGNVSVNVTLENSSTQEHAKNVVKESKVIQEKDTSGGLRTTTESKESEQILVSKENGVDRPVVVREIKPMIKGVLVIAAGAYDSTVKANLTKAVEAGLGIPSYKITVLAEQK